MAKKLSHGDRLGLAAPQDSGNIISTTMGNLSIRLAKSADQAAAYYVCLKTGDHGRDGEPFYRDDPDALGRIFVGPVSGLRARA